MSAEKNRRNRKSTDDEQPGNLQTMADEEPTGGSLAPSDELEAALRAATAAVGGGERGGAKQASADKKMIEALSTELLTLKAEYESALEELDKSRDQHLRLQAEFENFRRRGLKDKQESQLYGHQNFVKELLATVDSLDRAIEHAEQNATSDLQSLLQGVELVRRELLGVLGRFAVNEIQAESQKFDPALHEAMAQVPNAEVEPNTVLQVLQKGYQLRDRMLRPARVVVSKAPEDATLEPGQETAEE